jgi:hypothetical protein
MHIDHKFLGLIVLSCLLVFSCRQREAEDEIHESFGALPMNEIDLSNMDSFRSPGGNWSIAGNVLSDYQTEHSMIVEPGS